MTNEQYIEHEVKLRVMHETANVVNQVNDKRFGSLEETVKSINNKFNWIVGIFITSILIPVVLHITKLA